MDVLRKTPLFATLPEDDLRRVADLTVSRRFAKKEAVFREGDRADGFFIIASGKVKVFKLSGEGKEQVLHVLETGQTFAEAVIFEGGVYPAHAEALADAARERGLARAERTGQDDQVARAQLVAEFTTELLHGPGVGDRADHAPSTCVRGTRGPMRVTIS